MNDFEIVRFDLDATGRKEGHEALDRIQAERDRWRNASAIHTRTIAALVAERDGFCRVCGAGVPPLDGEGTCPDCPAALEGTDQG